MRTELQIKIEKQTSIAFIDATIRTLVADTDISKLINKYEQYMVLLSNVDSKHRDYHMQLLTAVSPDKAINTVLRALLKDAATNKSYTDRNKLASQIGRKLLPKSAKSSSAINRACVALTLGLNIVNIAAYCNLIQYKMITTKEHHTISTLVINPNLIKKQLLDAAALVRANNIMVCKPKHHTDVSPGGFYTKAGTMLNTDGFGTINVQSSSVCNAINALQDVQYALSSGITSTMLEEYKLHDKWYNEKGQFMTREWNKLLADLALAKATPFHFAHKFDKRGRMYASSTYLSTQGDKYQKSMLAFANKEHCTDEGLAYLAIAICNELYEDKISFDEAIQWMESKSNDELLLMAKGNPGAMVLVSDYIKAGNGEEVGTITHWDATNSGLQFYSLLGGDRQTASLCNILDTGVIADAYKALAEALNKVTDSTKFNRSNVKKSFMTFLYGSMKNRVLHSISDPKNGVTAGIAEFFPSNWDEDAMWEAFTTAMTEVAPAAINLMNLMYTYNTEGKTRFEWTMPDGFKVEIVSTISYSGTEEDDKNKQVRGWFLDLQGKTHEGTASVILEGYNKMDRSLAPNIIHACDSYFGREVIRRLSAESIEVSFIHDSFGVHPNNAARLHQVAREVSADILDSNLLVDILTQLDPLMTTRNIKRGNLSKGTLTVDDVLASNYILR